MQGLSEKISSSKKHPASMGLYSEASGNTERNTSNDFRAPVAYKANGQQCLNSLLITSYSAWPVNVKSAKHLGR